MRKGPDGKTIRGDEPSEDATRKVPRRSIRDRLLAQDEPQDETPATHLATTAPTNDPTGGGDPHRGAPGSDVPPTVYAGGQPPPLPRETAAAGRGDYIPADPTPPRPPAGSPPPIPAAPPAASGRDYIPADNAATKIYRPNRATPAAPPATGTPQMTPPPVQGGALSQAGRPKAGAPVSGDFTIADPVVGWLVVVEGPGRGASLNIGYGNNRIGRAPTENISLDFGDEEISRENHSTITFDGRHRRYYVLPGQGRNLVYVNDQPVMSPLELTGGEEILLGQTKLRFVPFCGKSFDWYQK